MKKKLLTILVCGVLVLGMTGCGNEKNEGKNLKEESQQQIDNKQNDDKQNKTESETLSCTTIDKNDDGTSRISYSSVVDFNYDGNYILDTIILKEEYKYNEESATIKKKQEEENLAKNLNESNGIKVEVGSNDISNVTVTTTYSIDEMDADTLKSFKYKDYISSKKFDSKKFQSDLIKEKNEKNIDITCTFK